MINEPSASPNHFFPARGLITNLIVTPRLNKRVEMSFASRRAPLALEERTTRLRLCKAKQYAALIVPLF